MIATILLCLLSTMAFCLCARGIVALVAIDKTPVRLSRGGFSLRARRMARTYLTFALSILATVSLVGAVRSFLDLFTA